VVEEIGLRRPTLDEVFRTLTGEQAGQPVAAGRPRERIQA
jgi:hypothetical protein